MQNKRVCLLEECKSGTNYRCHIHDKHPTDRNIGLKKYMRVLELRWEIPGSAKNISF